MSADAGEKNLAKNGQECLVFSLGEKECAIPMSRVRSVVSFGSAVPIPWMPSHFVGLVNLRGEIILVIDPAAKLNIKKSATASEPSVIILETGQKPKGLLVDAINRVERKQDDILELDELLKASIA